MENTRSYFPKGGGVYNSGSMTMERCVVSLNQVMQHAFSTRASTFKFILVLLTYICVADWLTGWQAIRFGDNDPMAHRLFEWERGRTKKGDNEQIPPVGGGIANGGDLTCLSCRIVDNVANKAGGVLSWRKAPDEVGSSLQPTNDSTPHR